MTVFGKIDTWYQRWYHKTAALVCCRRRAPDEPVPLVHGGGRARAPRATRGTRISQAAEEPVTDTMLVS